MTVGPVMYIAAGCVVLPAVMFLIVNRWSQNRHQQNSHSTNEESNDMKVSYVDIHEHGGATFVGPDAVNLFRAMALKAALNMYARCKMIPTPGVTATMLLEMAGEYSGKTYQRGEHMNAAVDVAIWIDTMKAAIPVVCKTDETTPAVFSDAPELPKGAA